MSCRIKSDQQMLLKRGRIPDALLVTNKVSPRLQFASAFWWSTGHWIGTVDRRDVCSGDSPSIPVHYAR
jgi:hypothetical protein